METGSQSTATPTPFNPQFWKPDPSKNSAENLASFDAYFIFLMADITSYRDYLEAKEKRNGFISDSEEEVERLAAGEEKEKDEGDDETETETGDEDSQEGGEQDNQEVDGENKGGRAKETKGRGQDWNYDGDSWYDSDPEVDSGANDSDSVNSSQYWGGCYI